MKKLLFLLMMVCFCLVIEAKTTYVATYSAKIVCDYKGLLDSISGIAPELSYSFNNDELVVTVLHEELDAKTTKSIKRAKANAGWSAVAAGLSAGTADRHDAVQTYYSMELAKANMANSESYKEQAADLQHLGIEVLIENNSDKEVYVNDILMGTIRYIKPRGEIVIPMMNPGLMQFRVAWAYPDAPDAKYFELVASSTTSKQSISYEDFDYIVFPKESKEGPNGYMVPSGYTILDKNTRIESPMTSEAFEEFKKKNKDKEKAFKDSSKK